VPTDRPLISLNLAVLRGVLSSSPEQRTLPSGRTLATIQLTTRPDEGPAISVPIAVWDPPAWVGTLAPGEELLVEGTVRRRFFRTAAGAASRVEVEAASVARPGDRRRANGVLRRAHTALDDAG